MGEEAWILGRVDGDAQIDDLVVIADDGHVGGRIIHGGDDFKSTRCAVPIAVTIFGVAKRTAPAILCYAFFRLVRGPGDYPGPALPASAQMDGIRRMPIEGFDGVDLVTWDKIFEERATDTIQAELDSGRFSVPQECPIESGSLITGRPFDPVIIIERQDIVRASGSGVLYVKGIAINDGIDRVRRSLDDAVGPAKAPAILAQLIERISEQSGLGLFFREHRRIGVVDQFYRAQNAVGIHGALFDVAIADRPDLRSKEPMRRVKIRRDAAAPDQFFRLHVTLKNFDEILKDILVDIPAGQPEIIVEAHSHITEFDLAVFDRDGRIADRSSGVFLQGFNFGLTTQGRVDELPRVFPGAPQSADLERRPRIHPAAFEGPAAGDRSGGFDTLRRHRQSVDMLIGEPGWSGENVWFELGGEGQIEVIRWIKSKIEKPGIAEAYLADPYLGSNALQRVIARQGNENIALTIVVSPGGLDPDADVVDAKATGDHLDKLVAIAKEWSERLCGQISICHIRRGEGAKQAFHDRYLSLVDQQGVPRVYLLSNSLSKAAGDWPFAICELGRLTSWQVHRYILALIEGKHGDRDLHPEVIWQSGMPANASVGASHDESQAPSGDGQPGWMKSANDFLQDLWNAAILNSAYEKSVGDAVDSFIGSWPQGIDTQVLADNLFRTLGHREEVIIFVSSRFAAGTEEKREVARRLDGMLLDKFLSNLPRDNRKAAGYLPLRGRRNEYLQHIGRTIAKMPPPTNTNFVRAELNPILHALVQMVETQRFESSLSAEALETGVCLVSVGLEVAIAAETAKEEFRVGMAADYIHWIGRLARSDAASRFDASATLQDICRDDLSFAAQQILVARKVLGEKLDEPIRRVREDSLVLSGFKGLLAVNA
ncbi:MAG TPA: VPA1262 family N-terminal domain-containing protein [Terriglobales bacterium]|nr:VPA1262 family N-terminal domain-containing protein [Terriglobales bacterium]